MGYSDQPKVEHNLKNNGHRLTKVRRALIDLFLSTVSPLSVPEILHFLFKKDLIPNKTTIYRELSFLKKQGIVLEIQLGENKSRYESSLTTHHHHLVCISCEKVEDVILKREFELEEERIAQKKQFKVMNHSLEFFGLCAQCQ